MKNAGNVLIWLAGGGAVAQGYMLASGRSWEPGEKPTKPDGMQVAAGAVFVLVGFGAFYYALRNWK